MARKSKKRPSLLQALEATSFCLTLIFSLILVSSYTIFILLLGSEIIRPTLLAIFFFAIHVFLEYIYPEKRKIFLANFKHLNKWLGSSRAYWRSKIYYFLIALSMGTLAYPKTSFLFTYVVGKAISPIANPLKLFVSFAIVYFALATIFQNAIITNLSSKIKKKTEKWLVLVPLVLSIAAIVNIGAIGFRNLLSVSLSLLFFNILYLGKSK